MSRTLSPRELQVIQMLANGKTTAQIAVELYLTEMTVRGYVKTALTRLGAAHRAHAVGLAYQLGLLTVPSESRAA